MSFEIVGKLYKKFPTESKSPTFQTRELVLEIVEGNYPQLVKFQLTQDRCQLLESYNEGEEIKVHFDLNGREWQGKFFTNLTAWRIEKGSGEAAATTGSTVPVQQVQQTATPKATPPPPSSDFPSLADEPFKTVAEDDLPF
jgi:single-strand DNA-binding protein